VTPRMLCLLAALAALVSAAAAESPPAAKTVPLTPAPSPARGEGRDSAQAPHPPIPVRFTLKEPGIVTLVIENPDGTRVRNIVSETPFPAGANVAWWDGLDDLGRDTNAAAHAVYHVPGKLVAPGQYRVRGIVRPEIKLVYEMTPYSAGDPPWRTKDAGGEWLTNHTPPSAVCFVPDGAAPDWPGHPSPGGQVLVGSYVSEGGSGLAWLDLKGRKVHGQGWLGGIWTGASHVIRDEGARPVPGVYAYTGSWWTVGKAVGELRIQALITKPDKTSGEDKAVLVPTFKFDIPPSISSGPWPCLGGMAVRNGIIVASQPALDRLVFVDAAAHAVLGTAAVKDPRGIALERDGKLLVLSERRLLRFALPPALAQSGPAAPFQQAPKQAPGDTLAPKVTEAKAVALPQPQVVVAGGLDEPRQLTLDGQGNIYVSDWGDSHQVKVFSAAGKFVRAIGEAGRPGVGLYNPNHMNHPSGIVVTPDGRLWVAEAEFTPKRLSVWTLDGCLAAAFYGPPKYGGGGSLDPLDTTRFFYADDGGAMELRLDWEKGTGLPVSVYYRPECDGLKFPNESAGLLQTPFHANGKTYLTQCYVTNPTTGTSSALLWMLDEKSGVARPAAALGRANSASAFGLSGKFAVRWTGQVKPKFSETYTFQAQADHGARLWVNGQTIVDDWKQNRDRVNTGTIALEAGRKYEIRMEYNNRGGSSAKAVLTWSSPSQKKQAVPTEALFPPGAAGETGTGLRGEYFDGVGFSKPVASQVDPKIDFNWGVNVPQVLLTDRARALRSRLPEGVNLGKDGVIFAWSDLNGDAAVQPEEVQCIRGEVGCVTVMHDLSMVTSTGLVFKVERFAPGGAPVYDLSRATSFGVESQRPTSTGGNQAILDKSGKLMFFTTPPKPFAPQSVGGAAVGKPLWSYPSLWPGLHASHIAPMPEFPGEIIGTTRLLGPTVQPRGSDAGEIVAINGNKGTIYLMTTDGLFVATLFKDSRTGGFSPPEAKRGMIVNDYSINEECFGPTISQTGDGRIYLQVVVGCIVRVDGLEGIRRLPESSLNVDATMLKAAQEYFVRCEALRRSEEAPGPLVAAVRAAPPVVDGKLDDWAGAQWAKIDERFVQVGDWGRRKVATEAALAVSGDRLYVALKTDNAKALDNSRESPQSLFRTGGGLDLMLDAVPGGERLLVARSNDKTVAVLYRPVAPGTRQEPVLYTSLVRTVKMDLVEDVSGQVIFAAGTEADEKAKIDIAVFEFSVPLKLLDLKVQPGMKIRGDVGVLRGNGFQTLQRVYWSNKATGLVSDAPTEADLTPQFWGEMRFE